MPSKTTGPQRAKRYRERLSNAGIRQVNVLCPVDRVDELRDIARKWADEALARFQIEATFDARQRDLPLGGSTDDD